MESLSFRVVHLPEITNLQRTTGRVTHVSERPRKYDVKSDVQRPQAISNLGSNPLAAQYPGSSLYNRRIKEGFMNPTAMKTYNPRSLDKQP